MTSGLMNLQRHRVQEIMDRPDLPGDEHEAALDSLATANRVSRTAGIMFAPILELAVRRGLRELSLLDVACGGGDVPVAIARLGSRNGVKIKLTLLDKSPLAIRHTQAAATEAGVECRTVAADLLHGEAPGKFDVVTNSLFLHHLDESDVVGILRRMDAAAGRLLVISDLRRGVMSLAAVWTACHALSRNRIFQHDGPVSVRAAWTPGELAEMARRAGLGNVNIRRCWPWRMLLTREKPEAA